jgi:hypothetical protein
MMDKWGAAAEFVVGLTAYCCWIVVVVVAGGGFSSTAVW